ncbi:MAG: hypothetical protein K2R98_14015 [Gemmataceae bacterium]|nr:hypothetical protein [Gemmataceae bacterium]
MWPLGQYEPAFIAKPKKGVLAMVAEERWHRAVVSDVKRIDPVMASTGPSQASPGGEPYTPCASSEA